MAKKLSDIKAKVDTSGLSFFDYLESMLDGKVFYYLNKLSRESNVFVFSGIIRNYFLGINNVRDIDIVLDGKVNIEAVFNNSSIRINSFGGYKIHVENIFFDIWYLENTWALKNEPVIAFELEKRVPYTSFFNFSSIVYSFNRKEFYYSKDFLRFLRDKKIDVVYKPNANYPLCLVNTFYYSDKYKLKIADNLKEYLIFLFDKKGGDYQRVQIKHFEKVMYTNDEINDRIEQIRMELKSIKK